jgi:TolB-like protein/DNA-binding winged helix-turn-helix (wHTH) protein
MHVKSSSPRVVSFGAFTVNLRLGELRKFGTRLKLQEQPFQVLALLLERPGDLVTREELRQRLWAADTFVDFDHGLNAAINRLRDRLGDRPENPRYIETVPRRGYRFIAAVDFSGAADAAATASTARQDLEQEATTAQPSAINARAFLRSKQVALGLAAVAVVAASVVAVRIARPPAATSAIHSLAVLPLQDLSGNPAQEYFSDGLTDELITQLSKIHSLRVISHTSVARYRGANKSLPEIARELNVDAIVEGSVVRSAEKVRVSAQLIDGRTDQHLWAESYERDLHEITTLQTEVARDIAISIHATMEPPAASNAHRPTPAAYEAYLRGRYHLMGKRTPDSMSQSIGAFQEAIRFDPSFALAYAGLADGLISATYVGIVPAQAGMPQAKAAVLKALELDAAAGEAHAALGVIDFEYEWQWDAAGRELRLAVQQAPNYALGHHYYANYLAAVGRVEEALAEIERAHNLDPFSFWIVRDVGRLNYFARRYEPALTALQSALALAPDSRRAVYRWQAAVYEQLHRNDDAVAADLKYLDASGWSPSLLESARATYRTSGWQLYWRKRLQLITTHPDLLQRETSGGTLSTTYARAGDSNSALRLMQRACSERAGGLSWIAIDPSYDVLRADARFRDLLRCVGLDAGKPSLTASASSR